MLSNDVPELQCCQEEADTRLFLHAKHASDAGSTVVIVRSPDTDVAVTDCFLASQITAQLLLHTGTKHRRRYISLSAVAERLGTDVCRALPGFHAFTRCDSTSAFSGRGKKNGFNLPVDGRTRAMQLLGQDLDESLALVSECEEYVSLLYGRQQTGKHL